MSQLLLFLVIYFTNSYSRIGFVRPGYDADLVVWDRHPLRVGATPLEVYIDGSRTVRASENLWKSSEAETYIADGPRSRPSGRVVTACKSGQSDLVVRGITKSFVGDDGTRSEEVSGGNLTAVIRDGQVICIGGEKCEEAIHKALDEGVASIVVENGHIIPVSLSLKFRPSVYPHDSQDRNAGYDCRDSAARTSRDAPGTLYYRRRVFGRTVREAPVEQIRRQVRRYPCRKSSPERRHPARNATNHYWTFPRSKHPLPNRCKKRYCLSSVR